MAKIEQFNSINDIMEAGNVQQEKRMYLGYSGVGGKCMRKVWYSFRWAYDTSIERRIDRIFRRGDIEEDRIVKDLARVGCIVSDVQREVVGITGHARGHTDGEAIGVPTAIKKKHLFEAKTMKAAMYAKYMKEGLQRFSSTYWQQIHSYMGHMELNDTLYVVTNKDTEERDYKRIKFDEDQFKEGERIALNIITAETAPPRMPNASRTFFECKQLCGYINICHKGECVARNCRTCVNWNIEDSGKFSCENNLQLTMDKERQVKGCSEYQVAPEYV